MLIGVPLGVLPQPNDKAKMMQDVANARLYYEENKEELMQDLADATLYYEQNDLEELLLALQRQKDYGIEGLQEYEM